MTIEEYKEKLGSLAEQYSQKAVDSIFVPAANELLANIKNRITQEGRNSAGSSIGQYSTKAAYYPVQQFVKKSSFQAKGKTGERVFANGQPHKTEYFPSGYKGLREKQGRRTDVMNESYSGGTMLAYQLQARDKDVVIGFTTMQASEIRKGQEKKRGKIFYATSQEIQDYNKNVLEAVTELTTTTLK